MAGKLIIVSAPSGSGKTTIVHEILERIPSLEFSVSATSREPRENEKDGEDYYFLSPVDFRNKIVNHEFVEWEEVYPDRFYGTLRKEIERVWKKEHHVLFDVDVKGGINLKKQFGEDALAIFIAVPNPEVLEERLRKRNTEDEKTLKTRIEKAEAETRLAGEFDEVVVNDKLDDAVFKTMGIIRSFLLNK